LLDYLKFTIYKIEEPFEYEVELTRQQIADLTGLRVETVIRSIKSLEKKGKLKIVSRKVWR
jgi:CRP-like cAMP-binding protein